MTRSPNNDHEETPGRVSELAALYHFTDRLYRAETLDEVYEAALDAILMVLHCSRASILLFDDDQVMRFVAWRGLSRDYREALDGHSPWTAKDRTASPICVTDIRESGEPDSVKAIIEQEGIRALAFIPLTANGTVTGKFMAYHDAPHDFTTSEINLALTIARQLGFSIERKRAEEARETAEASLRQSEERLRQIFDSAKEYAIITLNEEGCVTNWNSGAERLLGYQQSEILGRSADIFFTSEDGAAGFPQLEMRAARRQGRATNERWHVRKDGSCFWGSGVMLPIEDGGPDKFLKIFRDRTEERRAEERQELLIGELNHRVKNTLATVQSLAEQTLKRADTPQEFTKAFRTRLLALAAAHDLLTREAWEGAGLREIAEAILKVWIDDGRAQISGPNVRITPKQALALSMAYNELMTNAVKHGALSVPEGRVTLTWSCDGYCQIQWAESGGPAVVRPEKEGFGLRVLNRALGAELGRPVELEFEPSGVRCTIQLDLKSEASQNSASTSQA